MKKQKILKELSKGVSTLRTYLYPSVLQEAAIPILKKETDLNSKKNKNIIIKYSEMSGIKLTVLVPILD